MPDPVPTTDVLIIGGGPAGATSALLLARAGLRVHVLERARFPRFKIGESAMPRNFRLLGELGLEASFQRLNWVDKRGAEFAFGDGEQVRQFAFAGGLLGDGFQAFNIERAPFDAMLLDAARAAGAQVEENRSVRRVVRLAEGDVAVEAEGGEVLTARLLLDASGQGTFLGKHLGTRQPIAGFKKIAYYEHFTGVERLAGDAAGYPTIVMCDEGWFWIIPIDAERTSIGLVMDADLAREASIPAASMLAWGIERCPLMRQRMAHSSGPTTNQITADFSYRCAPYAGPGYFLVGDAATFVDPIFSTGLCLAMMGGEEASRAALALLRDDASPARVRRRYCRFIATTTEPFFRLVRLYYDHSFRELLLEGQGPFSVHQAALSVLAGSVFPKPVFALRWRMALLRWFVTINRYRQIVPARRRFSLFSAAAPTAETLPSAPLRVSG